MKKKNVSTLSSFSHHTHITQTETQKEDTSACVSERASVSHARNSGKLQKLCPDVFLDPSLLWKMRGRSAEDATFQLSVSSLPLFLFSCRLLRLRVVFRSTTTTTTKIRPMGTVSLPADDVLPRRFSASASPAPPPHISISFFCFSFFFFLSFSLEWNIQYGLCVSFPLQI